ncbi:MAG: coproporphyrinogen-III oxidase family protein [Eubacteriales bacterium]
MRTKEMLSCQDIRQLSIYIHIPFCVRKCYYCDFLSGQGTAKEIQDYVDALVREIKYISKDYKNYRVDTVFIGGGTPSLLSSTQILQIGKALHDNLNMEEVKEFTLEMNPGTHKRFEAYRSIGINRLSIGLQSAQNQELKALGRIHTYEEFLATYEIARAAGFDNINIDLMSALPAQDVATYEDTLVKICELQPEHISAYSLIIEEGTPFWERYGEEADNLVNQSELYGMQESKKLDEKTRIVEKVEKIKYPSLPDEDTERGMYEMTENILQQYGYHRYEISNYSKVGKECIHNTYNWQRKNYLGFGIGSASLVGEKRFRNGIHRQRYIENWLGKSPENFYQEEDTLSKEEQMEEFMFLGLRLIKGISIEQFQMQFQCTIWDVFGEVLKRLEKEKLLIIDKESIRLTPYGIDISNYVLSQFLLVTGTL